MTYRAVGQISVAVLLLAQHSILRKELVANTHGNVVGERLERHFKVGVRHGLSFDARQIPGLLRDDAHRIWAPLAVYQELVSLGRYIVLDNVIEIAYIQLHFCALW